MQHDNKLTYKVTYQRTNSGEGYIVTELETGEEVSRYFHATAQSAKMEFIDSALKGDLYGPTDNSNQLYQKICSK